MRLRTWRDLFTVGAQCGLKPNEVLDMSLTTFCAVIDGYQEHLFDLKCISVYQGFWAGYYGNTKRPKPLSTVLSSLLKEHVKAKQARRGNKPEKPRPDVDVTAFLERERAFKSKYDRLKGGK